MCHASEFDHIDSVRDGTVDALTHFYKRDASEARVTHDKLHLQLKQLMDYRHMSLEVQDQAAGVFDALLAVQIEFNKLQRML